MRNTSIKIVIFYIIILTSGLSSANQCSKYLSGINGEIVDDSTSLTKIIGPSTSRHLAPLLADSFAENTFLSLVKSKILYSDFFKTFVVDAALKLNLISSKPDPIPKTIIDLYSTNDEKAAIRRAETEHKEAEDLLIKKIRLLSPSENQALAHEVFFLMKQAFRSKDMNYLNMIEDPNITRDTFFSLPPEFIIDKIGENLIATGMSSRFVIRNKDVESFLSGAVGIPTSLSFLSTLISGFFVNDLFIFSSYSGDINSFTVGAAVATIAGVYTMFKFDKIFNILEKKRIKRYHSAAEQARNVTPSETLYLFSDTETGSLSDSIDSIAVRIKEPESNPTSLLSYGSTILNLHRELVNVFLTDFAKWMTVYETQSSKIKDKLNQMRSGSTMRSNKNEDVINFLSKVFIEAAEGTKQTVDANNKILDALNENLKVLTEMDTGLLSSTDQIDWARKSNVLRQSILVQGQFSAHLQHVYVTISNILAGLDQIIVAETAYTTRQLGNRLGQNQEISIAIDSLLSNLKEVELQLEALKN